MESTAVGGRQGALADIVRRAQSGDKGAFSELVTETSNEVYSLALRLVGDHDDARDITQDVYLRAFRSLARFRNEASVSTWLYRITANCASNYLRNRSRRRTGSLDDVEVQEEHSERIPERAADRSDDRRLVVAALKELPAQQRAVVVLHDIYDLSHEQIAKELQISRAASKVRLHRARRRLLDIMSAPLNAGITSPDVENFAAIVELPLRPFADARENERVAAGEVQ